MMRFAALFVVACGIAAADPSAAPMTILETAQTNPELSSLVDRLLKVNLVDTLSGPGPFTVFAPSNAAWESFNSTFGHLVSRMTVSDLQHMLEFHVLGGVAWKLADFHVHGHHMNLTPLFGKHLESNYLGIEDDLLLQTGITHANMVTPDVVCSNGVIHIVDGVLVPDEIGHSAVDAVVSAADPSASAPMTILETAQTNPELSSLVDRLLKVNLVDTLSGPGPFTVFAPSNAAWESFNSTFGHLVSRMTVSDWQHMLEFHVLGGVAWKLADFHVHGHHMNLTPLFGTHLESNYLGIEDDLLLQTGITHANMVTPDVVCSNGVIHIVDGVLVPDEIGHSAVDVVV